MSVSLRGTFHSGKRLVRRLAHVLAKPVKKDRGHGGVLIQPYRGYGSVDELFLMGRVFRQPHLPLRWKASFPQRDLLDIVRRFFRRGVREGVLLAHHTNSPARQEGTECTSVRVRTDSDGYFQVRLKPRERTDSHQRWHAVDLELVEPRVYANDLGAKVQGQVFIPPAKSQRVVISDIDDTVMFTGVVNKLKMMWRLFALGPKSRVAFPGVASLYRALHLGPSKDQYNPMLYVSRGPWSIYEILQEFFRLHRIPVGPILFLRDWGMSLSRPLPPRAEDHKLHLIRDMLKLYDQLPFVLIGDSGQHDPEIYARIVREHPGRVEAVYIRNVSKSAERMRAIEELGKQVIAAGSTLRLAADSFSMARHAARCGLISPAALDEILREQQSEDGGSGESKKQDAAVNAVQDQHVVEEESLHDAINRQHADEPPTNFTVESRRP